MCSHISYSPRTELCLSGSIVPVIGVKLALTPLVAFEAFPEKRQQLFRGPETKLASCVHFLDPALEMALGEPRH
jgi:hypothetical protein